MKNQTLNPLADTSIAQRYNANCLTKKLDNKVALQAEVGWIKEPRKPVICFPAGMEEKLGGALLKEIMPGLLSLPVDFLVLGKGSKDYGTYFTKLKEEHGHRFHIVENQEGEMQKMYAAADMALFLAEDESTTEINECLRFGVVPIAPTCERLEGYDPVQERGTAFIYRQPTAWHCFAAVVRALETYRFPFDWRTIQRQAMEAY